MLFIFVGLIFLADALLIYSRNKSINRFRIALFLFFVMLDVHYYTVGGEIDRFYDKNITAKINCTEPGNWSSCQDMLYINQNLINEYVAYKESQNATVGFLSSISLLLVALGILVIIYDIGLNSGLIRRDY